MEQKILEQITQVKDLKIESLVPNNIDGVTIEIKEGRRETTLPPTMTGESFRSWKKRRGGIFYRDLFLFLTGQPHGKYIQAEGENLLYILRIIDDEELSLFETKHLVHGKIKDQNVMILKNMFETTETEADLGYIEEINQEETEEEDPMIQKINTITLSDEDEANSGRSVSLFD
jgi:hypothetical protein